jgi:hypothetical protein
VEWPRSGAVTLATGLQLADGGPGWQRSSVAAELFGDEQKGFDGQYLRDFTRIVNEGGTIEDIVKAMLTLHGDRDNPRTLWHSARTAVAKRG